MPCLPERMKIEITENFAEKLYDKNKYVFHKGNLKLALNLWYVLKKGHRVIKFNRKA